MTEGNDFWFEYWEVPKIKGLRNPNSAILLELENCVVSDDSHTSLLEGIFSETPQPLEIPF